MPRSSLLAAALLIPAALAGCGSQPTATAPSVPRAAAQQDAELDWTESVGSSRSRLVFRVGRFSVTQSGWTAHVSVVNDTGATFTIAGLPGRAEVPFNHAFGVMLFRTGSHDELERRNAGQALPVLREAMRFTPSLPPALGPMTTWSGLVSSPGALPSGAWIRFVFGAFAPKGAMPESLTDERVGTELIWITDHAHRLR